MIRHTVRSLFRTPAFTAAAVLTLGLGIGACTAAYSLARGLMWRPLPFENAEQLVVVHGANPARGITDAELSYTDLTDLRTQSTTTRGLAALSQRQSTLGTPEGAVRLTGWIVDPALFDVLGMQAALGRTLRADEGTPGAQPVVVLSHRFWTRQYGRDSSVVGRALLINGAARTVVGVMPESFTLVRGDLFLPIVPDPSESRAERGYVAVGRLAGSATPASARAELTAIAARLESQNPATNNGWTIELNRYRDDIIDADARLSLSLMLGAVGVVLLIACANVAGLMLARAAGRSRELAVRAAIGASRAQLIRELLTECFVLSLVGGLLGLGLSVWWNDLMMATMPAEDLPAWLVYNLDVPALIVTASVTIASVFLCGLLPALRASRPAVTATLKGGGGTTGATRARSLLVVGQVAMAVVLLAAATLFSQSFLAVRRGNLGFDDRNVLTARVFFGALAARTDRPVWMRDALADVRRLPGVEAAALTGAIPGDDGGDHRALAVEGGAVVAGEEPMVTAIVSSDGLPDVLGLAPLAGRWFTEDEAQRSAPVAVIATSLAARLWPGSDPIGRRVRLLPDTTWLSIVGVISDLQYEEFGEEGTVDRLQIHIPYGREPWRSAAVMTRTAGDPAALAPMVSGSLRRTHADVPVFDVATMTQVRSYTTAGDRIWMLVFGTLGLQALLMSAIGLYGLLAYGVAQRQREIGVRVALGARPSSVVLLVVHRAMLLCGAGLLIGLGGGFAVSRLLRGMLFGVAGSLQPLALVSLLLLVTAATAALLPARRAATIDPMVALRND